METNPTTITAMIDMGVVRGAITALTMAVFFGITWWAYHRDNRERFEQDALLVFSEDELRVKATEAAPDEASEAGGQA